MDPRQRQDIVAVFTEEARQYILQMTSTADPDEVARAIHGIKGAAGMMGYDSLYRVIGEQERRYLAGDRSVVRGLCESIERFLGQMGPERESFPPGDLEELGRYFEAEAAEHMQMIERAVGDLCSQGADGDSEAALEELRRALHTLKGAADQVERTIVSQAAHAMEDLAAGPGAPSPEAARRLAQALPLLGAIVAGDDESAEHFRTLRTLCGPRNATPPPMPAGRGLEGAERRQRVERRKDPEGIIRVESRAVDGLLDGAGELGLLGQRLGRRALAMRRTARDAAATRRAVIEALRAVGPPKPWGPPAAALASLEEASAELGAMAAALDAESDALQADEETARRVSRDARVDLSKMRMAPARWLFERVAATIEAESKHTGRSVAIESVGTSVEIDRALAERLVDVMVQLARNGVVHGLEDPDTRAKAGKSLTGTMTLTARLSGGDVSLTVADDGRGIDVEQVRRCCIERGVLSPSVAAQALEREILETIFLPGFSMRASVDEHAGRGIGLDVVKREVERLGGRVFVQSQVGRGTSFEVRFAARLFLLWALEVQAADQVFAIPLHSIAGVEPAQANGSLSLAKLLGLSAEHAPRPMVVRIVHGKGELLLEVDRVLDQVELVTRRMPLLLEGLRPYLGTALGADGRVTLMLDPDALSITNAQPTRTRERLRVLLVEDSATTRELLAAMLRSGGHLVELAADGREALRRLGDRRFDVVVTDLAMPHLDGRSLVDRIRTRSDLAGTGIVIVTSRADAASEVHAEERGAVLLPKPVMRQRLLRALERSLEGC